jgi:hypothetical protein
MTHLKIHFKYSLYWMCNVGVYRRDDGILICASSLRRKSDLSNDVVVDICVLIVGTAHVSCRSGLRLSRSK